MLRALGVLAVVAIVVYALADLTGADDEERAGLPRGLWVVLIVVFPLIGAATYLVVSRTVRARRGQSLTRDEAPLRRPGPPRPFAPDDDPDFLRRLDEQQRGAADPDEPPADDRG